MDYRRTLIYRRALELVAFVAEALKQCPVGYGFLADQLRRASSSVALNFVEGCGRRTLSDRRRFFDMSIGSALETSAGLDMLRGFGALSDEEAARGLDLCDHLRHMLKRFA